MAQLILMRHGQSAWNAQNRFTGWIDIPLTTQGVEEARTSAQRIRLDHLDKMYTSSLHRSLQTGLVVVQACWPHLTPVIEHSDHDWYQHYGHSVTDTLPIYRDVRLNERYYGDLQGCNKQQAREDYGEEQVHLWRRSYEEFPPKGESLADTVKRVAPFFVECLLPDLAQGESVMVCAHGNSLRALIKIIENTDDHDIAQIELKTAECRIYQYDQERFERHL